MNNLTSFQVDRMSNEELVRRGIATRVDATWKPEPRLPEPRPPAPQPRYQPMNAEIPGTLYAVRALPSVPVKIGFTRAKRIEYRISSLQTGNPFPLKVVARAKCLPAQELEVHKLLAADRLAGEWFDWTLRVQAFVDALRAGRIARAMATIKE